MTLRNTFTEYVYTGPIRELSTLMGIDSTLREVDTEISKRIPAPNVRINAGDTACTFYNDSLEEFKRFNTYPETNGDMPVPGEIVESVRSDDDFWDVGGNIGIYSCMASAVIDEGSVTVVEPHPKNADRIRTNLELNGGDNEAVYQVALSSEPGELEFYLTASDVAGSYGSIHHTDYEETMVVETVPGDVFRIREDVPHPDVMKIDVEGAEYDVLCSLEETLSSDRCRLIYCNICTGMNNDVEDDEVYEQLSEYGYDVEPIWNWPDGQGHYVRAKK